MGTSAARASYTNTFEHNFDAKGRITVPADWRGENHERNLHVFPSSDGCLKVYPESWLGRLQEEMASLPLGDTKRKAIEALASLAQSVRWDDNFRITIKERLRTKAGFSKEKKEAVLVGALDHFQIWLRQSRQEQTETTLEEAAAALGI